jgi:hypothetical protein
MQILFPLFLWEVQGALPSKSLFRFTSKDRREESEETEKLIKTAAVMGRPNAYTRLSGAQCRAPFGCGFVSPFGRLQKNTKLCH